MEKTTKTINQTPIRAAKSFFLLSFSCQKLLTTKKSPPISVSKVSKVDGKTKVSPAELAGVDKTQIPLDTAWLANLFDGGLPW
jgi:hypothetical protein